MIYPLSKYKFHEYTDKKTGIKTVIAISTYAGKNVKGIAKCHPADDGNYDIEKGKMLAASRCNEKIALKRERRAAQKLANAQQILAAAEKHQEDMLIYYQDSWNAVKEANDHLAEILENL